MEHRAIVKSIQFRGGTLWAALAVLLALLAGHPSLAQTFSGSISGTVTDASGAAVRDAKLQLVNMTTQDTREQTSSAEGTYNFTNLLPAAYKITATAAGFKEFIRTDMVLRANTAATVDVHLEVGGTQEQIVVSAGGAALVDSASANNSITLDQVLLQALPNNTLQPLNFVYNFAGTTESQGGMYTRSSFIDQMTSTFGLNGGRSGESLILVDGASSTAIDWGGMMVAPIQDSVQEQQIVQNVYDAEYERGGTGVVTLVTRGGSSEFHGEIYDFVRNEALDANYWSNNHWGVPKGKFRRSQFGGNIGGPISKKHNLFFFAGYEALRQSTTYSIQGMVPTDAQRNGDFSGIGVPIYNPFSTTKNEDGSYKRSVFDGGKIPSNLFDKTGKAMVDLYPHENRPGESPNFLQVAPESMAGDKMDWRIDWAPSEKNRMFVRMSERFRQNDTKSCIFCNGADPNYNGMNHGTQVVLNDTIIPSPNWVIDMYGAFTRWLEGQDLVGLGSSDPSKIGLAANLFPQVKSLPTINVGPDQYWSTYLGMGDGYSTYDRYVRYISTGLVNVTRQFPRHSVKFGANYDVNLMNNRQNSPGIYSFTGAFTTDAADQYAHPGVTGDAIADMLLGTGNASATIQMDPAMSVHVFGLYLQDDWRLTQRLTISGGLRYDNQRPATERHNRIAQFNPKAINPISSQFGSPLFGAFEYAGVNGRPRQAWEDDNVNFGPRLGLAYRITDKLVWRAGAGIFYGPASAMLSFDGGGQSPGYAPETQWIGSVNGLGFVPSTLASQSFPNGLNKPTGNALGGLTAVGGWMGQVWPKQPHPVSTMYQWSTDFQFQVSPHAIAEIGYTGIRGRKLAFGNPNLDLDQLPTKYLAKGDALYNEIPNPFKGIINDGGPLSGDTIYAYQMLRPFPQFQEMQATRSLPGARSQYDALNLKYAYSFNNGLASITTYRWSKMLDNGSEALLGWAIGGQWRDFYNTKLDYGISTHDLPSSFAEVWLYQLPYGTGRRWGATAPRFVRETVGGWNVSGAVRLSSGYPLPNPVVLSGNNPLGGFGFPGPPLPDLVGNPKPKHRDMNHWINPDAFQGLSSSGNGSVVSCGKDPNCQPFPFRYGNEPQHMGNLREAGTKNLDLGIGKEFHMERVTAEFRGDFLNVFNHPIYGGSWGNIMNQTGDWAWAPFGSVNGTRNDPRNIQVALKLVF
jgi:hypothetical protein